MAVNAPDTGDPSTSLGLFTGEQAGTSTPRVYCTRVQCTREDGEGVEACCGLVLLGWELVVAWCFWGGSLLWPVVSGVGACCGLVLLGREIVVA